MITTHNLGFPRIGKQRELKFALEDHWRGELTETGLLERGRQLRQQNWQIQRDLALVPVGDFSFYDQVLDMSTTLGNLPERAGDPGNGELERYFRIARGRSPSDSDCCSVHAGEMTKWFDTNYHYIVPEFRSDTGFTLSPDRLLQQLAEAQTHNAGAKPVIIGPLTYLWLGKAVDGSNRLDLLEKLLPVYGELLQALADQGVEWVQIDEPALVTDLGDDWRHGFQLAYHQLKSAPVKLLLTTYFGELRENLQLACTLPVAGLHLDAVRGREEVARVVDWLPTHKVLSLGVIDGRNIWKTELNAALDWLEPIYTKLGSRLWLAPSCSLLHVPVDLNRETGLDPDLRAWLAFAEQKLEELTILARALTHGRDQVSHELADNLTTITQRQNSTRVINPRVREATAGVSAQLETRTSDYSLRARAQQQRLSLPRYPTTTIGSFPQTRAIRQTRLQFRRGELPDTDYRARIREEIAYCIHQQEALGLDVLVHGEAERNDMVEYFGEHLEGYAFTQSGWVQSYGSRCVKPPILYGDITRPGPMTVEWIRYARSLTDKPVKGMLTGPVTMLNWSFVRDDLPEQETCLQLALAIREEVLDLEREGVEIIQIDEAALREGLPLRQTDWNAYLDWATRCFRVTANGVADQTQIHTHMCYSEFNDILPAIAALDADVITIETSRSRMALLEAFRTFQYPNAIGPGVYDIHSPNVPEAETISRLLDRAKRWVPEERIWVNPDCGLKTRHWKEVRPALANMVEAARALRESDIALPAMTEVPG